MKLRKEYTTFSLNYRHKYFLKNLKGCLESAEDRNVNEKQPVKITSLKRSGQTVIFLQADHEKYYTKTKLNASFK